MNFMGLFFTTYRVEHKQGTFFTEWVTVITGLSKQEAERYIKDNTGGLFGESPSNYRIVKE